jgi:hypothetical protein
MRMTFWLAAAFFTLPAIARADASWVLDQSTLTYHVSHPLHQVYGVSHAARGKGVCRAGQCDFLIAVPVNSFDSGDSNRDLHMIQTVRGGQFPLIQVRTRLPDKSDQADLSADLDVEFAGQKAHYSQIAFRRDGSNTVAHISGTIPLNILDFKIEPPSLLTVPIKNSVPVKVELTWRRS